MTDMTEMSNRLYLSIEYNSGSSLLFFYEEEWNYYIDELYSWGGRVESSQVAREVTKTRVSRKVSTSALFGNY